ncbi:hypothetical protein BP6252_02650 [Coleophoma cylindrospora]|uniref:Uncharacterized protein n=1 Tax=Coleophoma cylindrospora TaxID=1849047 RepID=A0A3D8SFC8_9HELO|nr:hypothetical protein BP6252_02650 [Coleophoma cylindrospora]
MANRKATKAKNQRAKQRSQKRQQELTTGSNVVRSVDTTSPPPEPPTAANLKKRKKRKSKTGNQPLNLRSGKPPMEMTLVQRLEAIFPWLGLVINMIRHFF